MLECDRFKDPVGWKKTIRRGPRKRIKGLAELLIKQDKLTDQEMCDFIKVRYPEASTSVKCIQYYRYYLRSNGEIPPAKINRRKDKIVIVFELIPLDDEYSHLGLEGTYTGKQLIKKCRELLMVYGYSKQQAWNELYSSEMCRVFLNKVHWESIEVETIEKCKEYIDGDDT